MPCLVSGVSSLGRKQRTYSTLAVAGVTVTRFTPTRAGTQVTITATAQVEMTLGRLMHPDPLEVSGASQAMSGGKAVEIAMRAAAAEGLDEPVEAGAAGRHAAVRHVEAGHQVMIEIEARIGCRPVGRDQHVEGLIRIQSRDQSRPIDEGRVYSVSGAALKFRCDLFQDSLARPNREDRDFLGGTGIHDGRQNHP